MMVENKTQKMHDAGWSDCHSFCSYPSSRPRKVSIGITVEKYPKIGSGVRREDGAVLLNNEKTFSSQGKVLEENRGHIVEENRGSKIVETFDVKQAEGNYQKASAWFSSRSVRHETPTTETVQFYANKASVVQAKDGVHKKLDTVAYGKRQEKGGNIERVKEVAFAVMQEVQLPDKGVGREESEKVVKCNNEALRLKIWEILGTAPSQSKHTMNSSNIEDEKENLNINQNKEQPRGKIEQPKHNSDTIETDSESPNLTMRRPITRSLTRKRAPLKTVCKLNGGIKYEKKPLSSSGSDSKLKLQRNIFAFDDGEKEPGSLERTTSGHSNRIKVKRNEQKKAETEPKRIYSRRPLVSHKGLLPNEREQKLPSPDKTSLQSKETGGSPSPPFQDKEDFMQNPNMQKKARIEPPRIYSPRLLDPERNFQPNERDETLPSPDKASIQSKETGGSPSPPCQVKTDFMRTSSLLEKAKVESRRINSPRLLVSDKKLQPNEREQSLPSPDRAYQQSKKVPNDSHHSQTNAGGDFGTLPFAYNEESCDPLLRKKEHLWEHMMSPRVPRGSYLHKKIASPTLERETDLLDGFPSPTLAMNATPPSLSSSKLLNQVSSSPVLTQPRILTRNIYSSKILDDSRLSPCGSDVNTESTDDTVEIHESRDTGFQRAKEKETGKKLSLSPTEDQDMESIGADDATSKGYRETNKSEGGSRKKSPSTLCHSKTAIPCSGFRQAENWFLGAVSPKKAPFTLRHSNGVNSLKHVELRTEETTVLHKASEQHPENSLESDVVELALVLERFKGKLMSHTSKKSSEILSAAAEKICLQLQDVESQILADVGKFINTGKSKRKRFESRLEGQQERLKLIHDKFKEEVNQQLHGCRSTLEELDAHRMELKGSTDRQKASHRKLLLQVEEAMKAELRDAETRITAIDKEARKKMYGLKHVLKEWMEDGVIR